ncbi:hypothetical protein M758_4G036700 [Ceratodon purpureus]|nr:hypothetical protein M758_4G036700 [Ceratodon purpureus]
MEALERLQAVHAHVRLLHTHHIASAHAPTDRFLAQFLLLLGESGKSSAEMERLCDVLVDSVPKMKASTLFDDMAQTNASVSDNQPRSNSPRIQFAAEDKLKVENVTPREGLCNRSGHLDTNSQDLRTSEVVSEHTLPTQRHISGGGALNCMVSFKSMERARSTVEDFCRSYFMFHDMDVRNPTHVFRHLPLLVFVESYIYQLDEQNEEQLYLSPIIGGSKSSHEVSSKVADGLGKDPFAGLRAILHEQDLLTKRIEDELIDGVQYWRLEQSLCTALATGEEVKVEDVKQALCLKSFDYRVLNLLLYGLRKEPVNEAHYEFLSISELLVEIADDLYDYEVIITSIRKM